MQASCGGIFDLHLTANLSGNLTVKKFLKSVKNWQIYGHESVAPFFGPPCRWNAAENKAVVDIRLRSAVWCCPLVSQFQFALPLSTRAIAGNMTSSANLEIRNVLQRLQRRMEPRAKKVWWSLYVWFRRYTRGQTIRETEHSTPLSVTGTEYPECAVE